MTRTFLVLSGWIRDINYFKKFVSSAPKNIDFLFLTQKNIKNATSIRDFLFEKKIKKVEVVGHSTGGARAIEFATQFPDMVVNLYLVDSEGIYGREKTLKLFLNTARDQLHNGTKKIKANTNSALFFLKSPIHSFNTAKYAHSVDLTLEMQNLRCPTIIIWGEKDKITPLWQGRIMNKLIPNSKLIILTGLEHDWMIHSGEKFWESV